MAIEVTNGINVGHELIGIREFPYHLDLKVLLRLGNLDSVVLGEILEEMHTLMEQPVPGLSLFEFKRSIAEGAPFSMKGRATVATAEVRLQRFFEATTERSWRPGSLSHASHPGSDGDSCAGSGGIGQSGCN